jgi:glycosyltransferase involved in cell wall biosynthesis
MLDLTTRWNAKVARRVIAVSGQTRDDLVKHYRVPSSRIDVIYSGVDHERFHPGRDTTSDELPPGIRPPYLLFVSTIQPRKNLDRLLTAFKTLDRPDLQLVVAGRSGWMSGETELLMTDGSIENIKRMGYVASHHLAALYRQASAYVLPSLYEGFGLGVLEAMASGCPVVVSNRSSLPEIAGNAGVLVDPLDIDSIRCGILTAMDPQIRQRLIVSGIERAASFTWQRTAEMTIDTINCASTGTS